MGKIDDEIQRRQEIERSAEVARVRAIRTMSNLTGQVCDHLATHVLAEIASKQLSAIPVISYLSEDGVIQPESRSEMIYGGVEIIRLKSYKGLISRLFGDDKQVVVDLKHRMKTYAQWGFRWIEFEGMNFQMEDIERKKPELFLIWEKMAVNYLATLLK